jgi:hypothetical protein
MLPTTTRGNTFAELIIREYKRLNACYMRAYLYVSGNSLILSNQLPKRKPEVIYYLNDDHKVFITDRLTERGCYRWSKDCLSSVESLSMVLFPETKFINRLVPLV